MFVDEGGGGRGDDEKWSDVGYLLKIKSAGLSERKNVGVKG